MKKSTYNVRRNNVSTVKKSHARIPSAWDRRNSDQLGPTFLGAGPSPSRRSSRLIVLAALPLDPHVAPPRVLLRHADHELAYLRIDGRSSRSLCLVGPLATEELAMPAEQGGGRDDEARPALLGKDA